MKMQTDKEKHWHNVTLELQAVPPTNAQERIASNLLEYEAIEA